MSSKTTGYGICRDFVVSIGEVCRPVRIASSRETSSQLHTAHNVCFLHLALDQVRIVQVAIDELDLWVVFRDFGAFVAVSDEAGDVPVGMRGNYSIESITADVALGFSSAAISDRSGRYLLLLQ